MKSSQEKIQQKLSWGRSVNERRRGTATEGEQLSSGYFVVIPTRVENFHYTFCVCMKHFFPFQFGVFIVGGWGKENLHFSSLPSLRLMNCAQMNTSLCLIIQLVWNLNLWWVFENKFQWEIRLLLCRTRGKVCSRQKHFPFSCFQW